MKTVWMRSWIVILALGFGFIAQAQDARGVLQHSSQSFGINSFADFNGRIYYNCDSVESKVAKLLKQMGAQHIRVRCYGGMDQNTPPVAWEASVDLSYSTLRLAPEIEAGVKSTWTPVSIRESDDCHLLKQVFDRVKSHFTIRNLKGPRSCGSVNTTFRVQFETLKAE